jgi:uncharacterized protein YndB with AHSA1/START domain
MIVMPESATLAPSDSGGSYELVIERLLPATPERVFDAWVNPETLARWWGPEGFTDLSEGGRWRTVMLSPEGQRHIVSGVYRKIDRPARLVFTWAWEDEDGSRGAESEVDLTFRPAGSGTQLHLVHRRFASAESRDSHRLGWQSSFNDLERLFA